MTFLDSVEQTRTTDVLSVNARLRDHSRRPRVDDFALPVLGVAHTATRAAQHGFTAGVLDTETHGSGAEHPMWIIDAPWQRWAGFTLPARICTISARIAAGPRPGSTVMLGGRQAKAMPAEIPAGPRTSRCQALAIGEGDTRAAHPLGGGRGHADPPAVMRLDPVTRTPVTGTARPFSSPRARRHRVGVGRPAVLRLGPAPRQGVAGRRTRHHPPPRRTGGGRSTTALHHAAGPSRG